MAAHFSQRTIGAHANAFDYSVDVLLLGSSMVVPAQLRLPVIDRKA